MSAKTWIQAILHILIWSVVVWLAYTYANVARQFVFLTIQATREEYLAVPVFAQFTATQTLKLDRPALISELIVPLHVPERSLPLKIRLYNKGHVVGSWMYSATSNQKGVIDARFPMTVPMMLEGTMDVAFDGTAIPYDQKALALGIFIEPQDANYPNGNYRIAANEKQGDISLSLIEQKNNAAVFLDDLRSHTLGTSSKLLFFVSFFALLGCLPRTIVNLQYDK